MLHHLCNLLPRIWAGVVSAFGTTTLAVLIFILGIPIATNLVKICIKKREVSSLKAAFREFVSNKKITVTITLLVWIIAFGVFTIIAVYEDHQGLVAKIASLKQKEKPQVAKIENEKQKPIQVNIPPITVPPPTVIVSGKPPQRVLSPEQHNKLVSLLKTAGNASIIVRHTQGDFEAQTYSDYFLSALKDAGWTIKEPGFGIETRIGKGISIVVHDLKESLPMAVVLENSLKAIGVNADVGEGSWVPSGTFELYVGVQ